MDWIGGRFCPTLAAVVAFGTALGHWHSPFQASLDAQGQQGQPWFEEVAEQRGLKFAHQSGQAGEYLLPEIMGGGAALFDMDSDGDLDAYLVQSGNLLHPPTRQPTNRLYRNRGNGMFDDVTDGSGADSRGYGMGVTAGDYDNDGDVDLYVTNVGANVLLQNDGRGRFKDVTSRARVGEPAWSTSAAFLDVDGDGDLDLYVANYIVWPPPTLVPCFTPSGARDYCSPKSYHARSSDTLYRNNGNGTFTDISAQAGIRKAFATGLGVVSGDFDGNGSLDVFVANDGMPNQLWLNQGNGRFHDDALARGCAIDQDGRAKAGMGVHAVDVDDDGDLDLLVVNLEHESDSFYRNEGKFFVDDTVLVGLRTASRSFTRFGMGLLDFDNDGRLDLYEANGRISRGSSHGAGDPYAEPNLLFRGVPGGRFEEVRPRGGTNKLLLATSRAAAFGDVDNDGGIDIVVVNRDAPAYLLRNTVPSRGHWISFRLLDEHGREALGARLTLSVGQRRITREVQTAYSYLASNDPRVHVGLGPSMRVTDVRVRWPDGKIESFGDLAGDRIVTLRREGGGQARKP
jgi:hypothetical protein